MTEPQREDWNKIINELKAAGISYYKLGLIVGHQYKTIDDWQQGHGEPRHSKAKIILALHAEHCAPRETLLEKLQ